MQPFHVSGDLADLVAEEPSGQREQGVERE